MANTLNPAKVELLRAAFASGASVRAAMRAADCSKHTAMRYSHEFGGKPIKKYHSAGKKASISTIDSNGCVIAGSVYTARRRRLAILESRGERNHGYTADTSCGKEVCIAPDHIVARKWKMFQPPIATNPRCPYCGGGSFRLFGGVTKISKRTGETVSYRPRGNYLCRERGCGRGFYGKDLLRPFLPAYDPRCITRHPAIFWLGQLEGVSMHADAVPKSPHCKVKACVLPVNGNGQGLCHHHFHFFDRNIQRLRGSLDVADLFAADGQLYPHFHVGMMWQERADADRTRFEYKGRYEAGAKISEDYWQSAVAKALEGVRPKITIGENVQHTGAFNLWKGFGKKKIRKSQRNRPAGWHGNHPEQKPIKHDRETLDDLPTWTPADSGEASPQILDYVAPVYPLCQSYEILEEEFTEEEERDQLSMHVGALPFETQESEHP